MRGFSFFLSLLSVPVITGQWLPQCGLVICHFGLCGDGSRPPTSKESPCCPDLKLCPQDCQNTACLLAVCPDGSTPPTPPGQCCPDISACPSTKPDCSAVSCINQYCKDGSPAPVKDGECCPDAKLCNPCHNKGYIIDCWVRPKCPDGSFAPTPPGECCPSRRLCPKTTQTPDCRNVYKAGRLEIRGTRKTSIVFRSGFLIHVTVHPRFRFAS